MYINNSVKIPLFWVIQKQNEFIKQSKALESTVLTSIISSLSLTFSTTKILKEVRKDYRKQNPYKISKTHKK